jgi:ATP-dependent DNA ligase
MSLNTFSHMTSGLRSPVLARGNARKDSPYRSGRSSDWLKMKNPATVAVRREAEEDCGR